MEFTYSFCGITFNRKDNGNSDMKEHEENVPPVTDINRRQPRLVTIESTKQVCWCSKQNILLPRKICCGPYGEQGRECSWCHRPLPEPFYGNRTDVCEKCLMRRETWTNRQQRGAGIEALDGTANIETIYPNPGNLGCSNVL